GPSERLASACVAIAPASAAPHGTACPPARHLEATATPHDSLSRSKATIEKVTPGMFPTHARRVKVDVRTAHAGPVDAPRRSALYSGLLERKGHAWSRSRQSQPRS